jgi:hypothetical protein
MEKDLLVEVSRVTERIVFQEMEASEEAEAVAGLAVEVVEAAVHSMTPSKAEAGSDKTEAHSEAAEVAVEWEAEVAEEEATSLRLLKRRKRDSTKSLTTTGRREDSRSMVSFLRLNF